MNYCILGEKHIYLVVSYALKMFSFFKNNTSVSQLRLFILNFFIYFLSRIVIRIIESLINIS